MQYTRYTMLVCVSNSPTHSNFYGQITVSTIIVFHFSSAQMHSHLISAMLPGARFWILKISAWPHHREKWTEVSAPKVSALCWADTYLSENGRISTKPWSANAFTLFGLSLFSYDAILVKVTVGAVYSCLSLQSLLHTRHSRMYSRQAALFCKDELPAQYHQVHLVHADKRCPHGLSCVHGSQDIAI